MHRLERRLVLLTAVASIAAAPLVGPASSARAATTTDVMSVSTVPFAQDEIATPWSDRVHVPGTGTSGPGSPYPSALEVDVPAGQVVTDVEVDVEIDHEWPDDLDLMLVGPTGQSTVLMSDVGGGTAAQDISLTVDDEAPQLLPDSQPLSDGDFRPTNLSGGDAFPGPEALTGSAGPSLGVFDGTQAAGTWQLLAVDDATGQVGQVNWWLHLTLQPTQPLYPSSLTVSGLPQPVTDVDLLLDDVHLPDVQNASLLLQGPTGAGVLVLNNLSNAYGTNHADIVFDDEATAGLPFGNEEITSGSYRPYEGAMSPDLPAPAPGEQVWAQSLDTYDGAPADGTWRLFAYCSDEYSSCGEIAGGWGLRITVAGDAGSGTTPTSPPPTAPAPTTSSAPPATDTLAPRVAATAPRATGRSGVRADVTARLSEKVRPGTVTRRTAYLTRAGSTRHLGATVSWQPGTRTVVIDPARALRHGTRYRVVVTTAVKDQAGNRLDQRPARSGLQPKTWTFTTR
jgi:subtilisin-like proprotein convertase family protein